MSGEEESVPLWLEGDQALEAVLLHAACFEAGGHVAAGCLRVKTLLQPH